MLPPAAHRQLYILAAALGLAEPIISYWCAKLLCPDEGAYPLVARSTYLRYARRACGEMLMLRTGLFGYFSIIVAAVVLNTGQISAADLNGSLLRRRRRTHR